MTAGGDVLLPCRGVLLDNDGVLVASDASVGRAWSRWALVLGLPPEQVLDMVHGRRAADTVALLVPPAGRAEALRRINAFELEDAASVTAVPGAAALLASLPAGSWAVVTSATDELASARLRAAGLSVPPVLVTADDVEAGKPAPDGYLAAAARLGLRSQECVVLEDAVDGVAAARAAGVARVLGVGPRTLSTDADVVVPDLRGTRRVQDGLLVDGPTALRT